MEVAVFNQQHDVPIDILSVEPLVMFTLTQLQAQPDEVSIYFVSEQEISHLHKDFFNDPTPTDCISLPIDPVRTGGYQHLGEIFVCPKTALHYLNTKEINTSVYREISLYTVHGLLHLLGYDDLNEQDATVMEQEQTRLIELLNTKNLLLRSTF